MIAQSVERIRNEILLELVQERAKAIQRISCIDEILSKFPNFKK